MKSQKTIFWLVLLIMVFPVSNGISANESWQGIPLSQVPKNVRKAAEREVRGVKLLDAKILKTKNGEVLYELDGAVGQQAIEILVDSEGNIQAGGSFKELSQDVSLSRVPGNILMIAKRAMRGIKIIKAKNLFLFSISLLGKRKH